MQSYKTFTIWLSVLLLILFLSGCGCPPTTAAAGLTAPTVTSVAPPNSAAGVCATTIVTATFSAPMDPTSLSTTTFKLTGPNSASVAGQVTYNAGSNTAIFTPTTALALGTIYTATVTTG